VLQSTFTVALKPPISGTDAKAQRKQLIALNSDNSNISTDRVPPEITVYSHV